MPLRLYLNRLVKTPAVDARGLKRFARGVLRGEAVSDGALTVVFTDDAGIRLLNRQFRDKDRPTDVLSFPLHEDDEQGPYLGDVIISLERALKQAPRFHNEPEAEIARLVAHGILHILGYDHHRPADGRRMKAAERRALTRYEPGTILPQAGSSDA